MFVLLQEGKRARGCAMLPKCQAKKNKNITKWKCFIRNDGGGKLKENYFFGSTCFNENFPKEERDDDGKETRGGHWIYCVVVDLLPNGQLHFELERMLFVNLKPGFFLSPPWGIRSSGVVRKMEPHYGAKVTSNGRKRLWSDSCRRMWWLDLIEIFR